MNSLRRQLLWRVSVGLCVVLGISGAFLYLYLRHVLVSAFDAELLDKARLFAKTTEMHSDGSLDLEFTQSELPEYTAQKKEGYFEVWNSGAAVTARSPSLDEQELPRLDSIGKSAVIREIDLPDRRRGRAVYLGFVPRSAEEESPVPLERRPTLTLCLAEPTSDLSESLSRVSNGLILAAIALVLGVIPTVWWSIRRGLRSLDKIGEQASAIDANSLSFRFTPTGLPRELQPITGRLNDLLDRLQTAFERERRFTSDAAHELRTPIAELRTLAEVGISEAGSYPDLDNYFRDVLSVAHHLESLVATLLALARCESGLQTVNLQPVNVSRLVQNTWDSFSSRNSRGDVKVSMDLPPHAEVESDPDLLKTIFVNLFSNGMAYASSGGRIDVAITPRDSTWAVSVSNTTDKLKSDDVGDVFKPFWRKSQGEGTETHYGLGLALVAAYSSLLGLVVRAEMIRPDIFNVEVICRAARS